MLNTKQLNWDVLLITFHICLKKLFSCLFYQDTTKNYILWVLTIASKQTIFIHFYYFPMKIKNVIMHCHHLILFLRSNVLHSSLRFKSSSTGDIPFYSLFCLDKGLNTCTQGSNVRNRRYDSDNYSLFSDCHNNGWNICIVIISYWGTLNDELHKSNEYNTKCIIVLNPTSNMNTNIRNETIPLDSTLPIMLQQYWTGRNCFDSFPQSVEFCFFIVVDFWIYHVVCLHPMQVIYIITTITHCLNECIQLFKL